MQFIFSRSKEHISLEFFKRLCEFIKRQPEAHPSDVWKDVHTRLHSIPQSIAERSDYHTLSERFSTIYDQPEITCLDYPGNWSEGMTESEIKRLLSILGSRLGFIPTPNPEQPYDVQYDIYDVLIKIESRIGHKLTAFGGGNIPGARCYERFIPPKMIESEIVLEELDRDVGDKKVVLEIGSGTGWLAMSLAKRNKIVHTIDMPVVSMIQAYMCAVNLGEGVVSLHGECASNRINIHGLCINIPTIDAAIAVNCLPELPRDSALEYVGAAINALSIGGVFCSINHESERGGQGRTWELMQRFNNVRQLDRTPCWYRTGYLKEVWIKQSQ